MFNLQANRVHNVFTQPFLKDGKRTQAAVQGNTLCLRKNVTLIIFVIAWSDVIQFCQFLAETYSRKFGTNTNAQATTSRFICSYCTV